MRKDNFRDLSDRNSSRQKRKATVALIEVNANRSAATAQRLNFLLPAMRRVVAEYTEIHRLFVCSVAGRIADFESGTRTITSEFTKSEGRT